MGLVVEGVSHAFDGRAVVRDINLQVAPSELVCLLGPSGCGKTTILRIVAGLEELQSGRIVIDGRSVAGDVAHVPPEQRRISLLFQDFALFPHLTVMENVVFGLGHWPLKDREPRAFEVLEQGGMLEYAQTYPHVLSGGQQQRVALARARAPRPRVMLLDEPFSNLDVGLKSQIRDIVLHVLKNSTASTLFVTHDPEEAMFMADRIAVMQEGRIVQVGTPDHLYAEPANAFVAGLFSEINTLQGVVAQGHVATPLGRVCAPGLAEGLKVEVLMRSEALKLVVIGKGAPPPESAGKVVVSRLLGGSSLVHLRLGEGEEEKHLHARVPGRFLPDQNEIVGIELDQSQAFVFPVEKSE